MECICSCPGFQFDISHPNPPGDISITDVSGGDAAAAGFSVSFSDNLNSGTVLGFSFAGDFIAAGSGVLTTISYSGSGNACFSDIIIAGFEGGSLSSEDGGCADFPSGSCDDVDADGICDDIDDCVGEYDESATCNGDGFSCGFEADGGDNEIKLSWWSPFRLDGIDSSNNDITLSGSTDQRGHVRILRGLTLLKGNSSMSKYLRIHCVV